MYKGGNGFTLEDSSTKWGWEIKNTQDIITALEGYPAFSTVAGGFIGRALYNAMQDRKHYKNIEDLAQYLLENYI